MLKKHWLNKKVRTLNNSGTKKKIDPAITTSPFISITNDIIGMLLYMNITVLLS